MTNVYICGGGVNQKHLIDTTVQLSNINHVYVIDPVCQEYFNNYTSERFTHIKHNASDYNTLENIIIKDTHSKILITDCEVLRRGTNSLADRLGLYNELDSAIEKFTDKYCMYKSAIDNDVPVIPTYTCPKDLINVKEFISKPRCGCNSDGVVRCTDIPSNLNTNDIYQPVITGTEITLEGLAIDGKHTTIATSVKSDCDNFGVYNFQKYPTSVSTDVLRSIINHNDKYINSTGIKNTLTQTEWLVNKHGYYLMDAACRTGTLSSRVISTMYDINVYSIYLNSIIHEPVSIDITDPEYQCALWFPNLTHWANRLEYLHEFYHNHSNVMYYKLYDENIKNVHNIQVKSQRHANIVLRCSIKDNIYKLKHKIHNELIANL